MTLGSFKLGGKTINVEPDYTQIDGRIYRLIQADTGQQVAVTTYRGLNVADYAPFKKAALQDGLRSVLRQSART